MMASRADAFDTFSLGSLHQACLLRSWHLHASGTAATKQDMLLLVVVVVLLSIDPPLEWPVLLRRT